ncbi:peptidase domain-containing ABC transporter [Inhella proteolytica]|uniref:Cyclolysin secretion/processing ATP-binding protein CyaB n=1 Tax=Inhella proteolytica TaxID=2795029 RepID=A0A931J0N2_9BURK|nr:peptidase domain-containing ABC transporter [Inhella proteolytica]MBH9575369.1 peptidase domain-containing ABC transporter [Inhella proteolytica]
MKPILQCESAECGLAALLMVVSVYGQHVDLSDLRRRFPTSLKGANLRQLIQHAAALGFSSRPLRLDLDELKQLATPCILHWDLNHFVVLKKVTRRGAVILDPAVGERSLTTTEIGRHFTGVALELIPNADFKPEAPAPRVSLQALTGKVMGLKRSLLQIFAVAVVLELFAIVAPLMSQLIVDDVLASGDGELLTVIVLGFGLLLLIQTLLALARSWMVMVLGQTLSLQWLGNVFAHLIKLPTSFFEKRHLGDITSRFGAVNAIQRTLTTAVVEAVLDGLMAVAALLMMTIYAPSLCAIVLGAVAAYAVLRWAMYRPFRDAAAERLVIAARESTHFLETLRAITPLKLFGREQERRARWQNLIVDVQNRDVRTARMGIAFSTANTFIFGLENLLVFWVGGKLILAGQMAGAPSFTIGMLFAFIAYKGQFTGRVSKLIDYAVELKMLGLHSERLADIVLEPPEKDDASEHDLAHLRPSIELKSISFRYAEGEPWVLKDANFKVEAGESVAVTGPSGAGKTTLLKIALGLLQPTEGEVLYGGQRIQQLGLQNVRRQIGTVMQEDVLLTGSLADNIAFFDVAPNLERVQACAQLAQLHEDISKMPMGYQTLVGDLGQGLSGGQKQRLLLARALYKQPKVLALDEATSHLDLGNERAVTATLAQMNLTRLIIAHRPETIAGAQRVVQVREGQVMELARALSPLAPDTAGVAPVPPLQPAA